MDKSLLDKRRIKTTDGLALYMEKRHIEKTQIENTQASQTMDHSDVQPLCVIFSHGLSGSGRNWRSAVNEVLTLPGTIAVYYDLRGHGRSPGLNQLASYSLDRLAQDLIELAQMLKAEHPAHQMVLVGLSLGAMVSLRAAVLRPDLFKKLCLTSMPCRECPTSIARQGKGFASAIRDQGLEAAGELYVWGESSGMRSQDAQWVKQGFLEHKGADIAYLLEEALAQLPTAAQVAQQLSLLAERGLGLALFLGDQDKAAVLQFELMQEVWGEQRPYQLETQVFLKGQHVLNLTSSKAFNAKLLAWLTKEAGEES